jgi:hypothetical protein
LKIFFCSAEGNGRLGHDPQQTAALGPAKLRGDLFFRPPDGQARSRRRRLTPL